MEQLLCQPIFKTIQKTFFSIFRLTYPIYLSAYKGLRQLDNFDSRKTGSLKKLSFKPEWFVDLFRAVIAFLLEFNR